jgi:hypothetical protein
MRDMGLYRGKRVDNGEWVEGYPVPSIGVDSGRWLMTVIHSTDSASTSNTYAVDPKSIGQFTGLCDRKDKPERVWEGDQLEDAVDGRIYTVEFSDGAFCAVYGNMEEPLFDFLDSHQYAYRYGTIHDAKEG